VKGCGRRVSRDGNVLLYYTKAKVVKELVTKYQVCMAEDWMGQGKNV
jgi:hypothetical protein